MGSSLWESQSFTVTPEKSREGYRAEITDASGGTIATCDNSGTLRDASGDVLLQTPVTWNKKRHGPSDIKMEVSDPSGSALGVASVVKYGVGPRAKKAIVSIKDAGGAEVARLEATDKRGEELAITNDTGTLATLTVSEVKTGFMRKTRVYSVQMPSALPENARLLVYATAIRYDGLLDGVLDVAMRESNR